MTSQLIQPSFQIRPKWKIFCATSKSNVSSIVVFVYYNVVERILITQPCKHWVQGGPLLRHFLRRNNSANTTSNVHVDRRSTDTGCGRREKLCDRLNHGRVIVISAIDCIIVLVIIIESSSSGVVRRQAGALRRVNQRCRTCTTGNRAQVGRRQLMRRARHRQVQLLIGGTAVTITNTTRNASAGV